jgi:VanZ like family
MKLFAAIRTVNRASLRPEAVTVLAVLVVLLCTLFPFSFTSHSLPAANDALWLKIGPELGHDIIENAALFVPVGLGLSLYLNHRGHRGSVAMAAVLATSFVLSYAVEQLQLLLPDRVSSLTDVFANTAGGCLGFVLSGRQRQTVLVDVIAYFIAISLISIPLQWSTTLSDWEREFSLMVGNERTGDRPWHGRVLGISVFDRALSKSEVADVLVGREIPPWIVDSAVASYEPNAPGGYRDRSGHLPPFAWRTAAAEGAGSGAARWLETTGPAAPLVDRVKIGSAFTLLVKAATEDTDQTGPARIVSLSRDTDRHNFMLGQSGNDLVFRLRTPLTGEDGSSPEFIVPDVFHTRATQHLAITYDGLDLKAYIDGSREHAMRLGLGAAAFEPAFRQWPQASYAYSILYYALVFLPAGMLISRLGNAVVRPPSSLRLPVLAGGVLICSLLFESILMVASDRLFHWSNVFWVTTFAGTGIAALELERRRNTMPSHAATGKAAS